MAHIPETWTKPAAHGLQGPAQGPGPRGQGKSEGPEQPRGLSGLSCPRGSWLAVLFTCWTQGSRGVAGRWQVCPAPSLPTGRTSLWIKQICSDAVVCARAYVCAARAWHGGEGIGLVTPLSAELRIHWHLTPMCCSPGRGLRWPEGPGGALPSRSVGEDPPTSVRRDRLGPPQHQGTGRLCHGRWAARCPQPLQETHFPLKPGLRGADTPRLWPPRARAFRCCPCSPWPRAQPPSPGSESCNPEVTSGPSLWLPHPESPLRDLPPHRPQG